MLGEIGSANRRLNEATAPSPNRRRLRLRLRLRRALKVGREGWMESLQTEVAPFGIAATIVNPGFFRTELMPSPPPSRRSPI